jgi:hypothetical protein
MSKRKGILAALMENHSENMVFQNLLTELLNYYQKYDWDNGTLHAESFKALFYKGASYDDAANAGCVGFTTLPKYVERYNRQAQNFINNMPEFQALKPIVKDMGKTQKP